MAFDNWNALKVEYLNSEASTFRQLEEKYGVSLESIAEHSKAEGWVELRQKRQTEIQQKLNDKAMDSAVNFQKQKLEVGKYMVSRGVEGLRAHAPRSARESKEVVEVGYKIATEAMGLDKAGVTVNVGIMSIDDFDAELEHREKEERERQAVNATIVEDTAPATATS